MLYPTSRPSHDVQNRPARTLVRADLLRGVRRGKLQLDARVLAVLAEVSTRKLRALVTAEAVDELTGGNDGPFVEQREGVYRAGLCPS